MITLLAILCWVFVLLPVYPTMMLMLAIGKCFKFTDVGFVEFTQDWFTYKIIP